MTITSDLPVVDLPALPFERDQFDVNGIAPLFRELRDTQPIVRVRTSAGDEAWLVTRYEEVKTLLNDPRLGRSHPEPAKAARVANAAVLTGPLGTPDKEVAARQRFRRLIGPSFAARRVEKLRGQVQEIVDQLLDDLAASPQPADFHEALSFPLPVLVICQLLGVPTEDRTEFRHYSAGATALDDPAAAKAAWERLVAYMYRLIDIKRAEPGEDVFSDLLAVAEQENLTDDEIARMGAGLLFAGHETTVTRLDLGTLLLLTHPDQREKLQNDLSLVPSAVEEMLRMVAPSTQDVLPRYAHQDITVCGTDVPAGDLVLLAFTATNRDPDVFVDPDRFDITRDSDRHIAFGHGPRFCIGSSLARAELQCLFATLLVRFPNLQLAVPPAELEFRDFTLTGGVTSLPVTW
ncbi:MULTISPECIES: cytochrome P450 [Micromonospora]|uniref:Cytochrome P450 n=1 Tax=Micromonospora antibiotica TaxID=2807623 RepID=A0ABS3VFC2_9ACTN|nr:MULTISPECIES: cytochrome P450 [Micromonospora]MBO4164313.1 cytochrome P450 [Micromonospora antibiotica]MBW4705736.1 cytochrome P450 [Micromonospora sp. RL09-050-HVF-A]